jgi:phosphatidylglycerophosphate synthase
MAFFSALIACFLLYFCKTPAAYFYWAIFNFIWYLLDALDGIHARRTQQTSEYGAFLDHMLDNVYFIFMFAVFVVKFHLLYPLYVFIIILRITAATTVFIAQVHTGKLYLSKFSGGLELFLMTSVMLLSYFYPNLNLTTMLQNPILVKAMLFLALDQGVFMKIALLVYLVGVPLAMLITARFVKQELFPKFTTPRIP